MWKWIIGIATAYIGTPVWIGWQMETKRLREEARDH